jgi:DNA-binding NtrC family response regulator
MADTVPKVRIFLGDDEEQFALTQTQWLEKQGYAVTCASSVEGAKKRLKKDAQKLDLALIDMYMGSDKQGGLELVKLISEKYPWIVSIVITAHSGIRNAVACMEAGAFSYIIKGEDTPELKRQTILKATERFRKTNLYLREFRRSIRGLTRQLHNLEELIQRMVDELPAYAKADTEGDDDQETVA